MKTRQAYLLGLLLYAGFSSCSESEYSQEQQQLKEVSIMAHQSNFEGVLTRATDTSFEVGDSIGVYAVLHQDGKLKVSGNVADNKKWILTEENGIKEWKPATNADKIYYRDVDEKLDFYAYYPYNRNLNSPLNMSLAVQTNQSGSISSSDFMIAKNLRGLWRGPVSLQFSHQLSRLEVTVVRVLNTSSTNNVLNVWANSSATEYNFNLQTEELTVKSGTPRKMQMQYISTNSGDNVNTEIKYLFYLILPPQEIAPSKDCFEFDLDGRKYSGKTNNVQILTASKRTASEMILDFNPIFQNN